MKPFAVLFKKYRLLAKFSKIPELTNAFAEKGFFFDISIYYHWQKGKRIPYNRQVIVALVILFVEKGAITTLDEANEFLESAGHGYLTKREQACLML